LSIHFFKVVGAGNESTVTEVFQEARKLRIGLLEVRVVPETCERKKSLLRGAGPDQPPRVDVEKESLVLIHNPLGPPFENPKGHKPEIGAAAQGRTSCFCFVLS